MGINDLDAFGLRHPERPSLNPANGQPNPNAICSCDVSAALAERRGASAWQFAAPVYRRAYPAPGSFARKVKAGDWDAPPRCSIVGCDRPTQRYVGGGLSWTHCGWHIRFKARHGSYFHHSYTASQLAVYLKTAERFLRAMRTDDLWLADARRRIEALYWWAGEDHRAADVLTMRPRAKARAAFARLRSADIPIDRILARCLAVELALAEDPTRPHGDDDEFQCVQLAKVVTRLAGGHRYDRHVPAHAATARFGAMQKPARPRKYGIYTRSAGLFLRIVGAELVQAISPAVEHHLSRLRGCKALWYGDEQAVKPG